MPSAKQRDRGRHRDLDGESQRRQLNGRLKDRQRGVSLAVVRAPNPTHHKQQHRSIRDSDSRRWTTQCGSARCTDIAASLKGGQKKGPCTCRTAETERGSKQEWETKGRRVAKRREQQNKKKTVFRNKGKRTSRTRQLISVALNFSR